VKEEKISQLRGRFGCLGVAILLAGIAWLLGIPRLLVAAVILSFFAVWRALLGP